MALMDVVRRNIEVLLATPYGSDRERDELERAYKKTLKRSDEFVFEEEDDDEESDE